MPVVEDDYEKEKDKMPLVVLSRQQVEHARELGFKRSKSYTREGYGTERGDNLPNVHTAGVLAEMAAADYYGTRLDERVIDGGDEGADLCIADTTIDVKANRRERKELLVKEHKAEADVFLLCDIEAANRIRLVGYAMRSDVVDRVPQCYPTDIRNYVLHWTDLERVPEVE